MDNLNGSQYRPWALTKWSVLSYHRNKISSQLFLMAAVFKSQYLNAACTSDGGKTCHLFIFSGLANNLSAQELDVIFQTPDSGEKRAWWWGGYPRHLIHIRLIFYRFWNGKMSAWRQNISCLLNKNSRTVVSQTGLSVECNLRLVIPNHIHCQSPALPQFAFASRESIWIQVENLYLRAPPSSSIFSSYLLRQNRQNTSFSSELSPGSRFMLQPVDVQQEKKKTT